MQENLLLYLIILKERYKFRGGVLDEFKERSFKIT